MKPLARGQRCITSIFVPLLLGAIGLFYVVRVFGSLGTDTTAITNTAFVAMASLAALAFGWVRGGVTIAVEIAARLPVIQ
jgi:hypothetical protein